jgi:hypothetical protein
MSLSGRGVFRENSVHNSPVQQNLRIPTHKAITPGVAQLYNKKITISHTVLCVTSNTLLIIICLSGQFTVGTVLGLNKNSEFLYLLNNYQLNLEHSAS